MAERVSATGQPVSEGSTNRKVGTTGVQDHSMHTGQVAEHLRSAPTWVEAPRPWPTTKGQGLRPESEEPPDAEVRYLHSSLEAGQLPWSEGRYGE